MIYFIIFKHVSLIIFENEFHFNQNIKIAIFYSIQGIQAFLIPSLLKIFQLLPTAYPTSFKGKFDSFIMTV